MAPSPVALSPFCSTLPIWQCAGRLSILGHRLKSLWSSAVRIQSARMPPAGMQLMRQVEMGYCRGGVVADEMGWNSGG